MSTLHLADAKHRVLETSEADATIVFVFLAFVVFVQYFLNATVALVAVHVVFLEANSTRSTLVAVVKRLFVLVNKTHEFADVAVHRTELEPAFDALDAERLLHATFSAFDCSNITPVKRMVFSIIVTLSTTVKPFAGGTLLETAANVMVASDRLHVLKSFEYDSIFW